MNVEYNGLIVKLQGNWSERWLDHLKANNPEGKTVVIADGLPKLVEIKDLKLLPKEMRVMKVRK